MSGLVYAEEELLRSHEVARPHLAAGRRLHGGFDAAGRYLPPRLLVRGPAVDAWTEALRARGGAPLPADSSLLAGVRYPNEGQMKLLLQEGLGQSFWNTLTITGRIEARGRALADLVFPDLQDAIVEDVSTMAIGHLNRGLLRAHGLDEGGEPEKGIGGHDFMWFALRDLAFGRVDWPQPAVPENIARPESGMRRFDVSPPHLRMIDFLLNLLMIELRAERGFSLSENLLRDPELFGERRAEALEAAELVGCIRSDEEIHVRSLRLVMGELRSVQLRTSDGGRVSGRQVVDALWADIVHWATVVQPPLVAAQQRAVLAERVRQHPRAGLVLARLEALGEG